MPVGFWTEDSLNGTCRRYPIFKQFGFCRIKYKTVGCSQTFPFYWNSWPLFYTILYKADFYSAHLKCFSGLCNPCFHHCFILSEADCCISVLWNTECDPHSLVPQARFVSLTGGNLDVLTGRKWQSQACLRGLCTTNKIMITLRNPEIGKPDSSCTLSLWFFS